MTPYCPAPGDCLTFSVLQRTRLPVYRDDWKLIMRVWNFAVLLLFSGLLQAATAPSAIDKARAVTAGIDTAAISQQDGNDWLSHGRDYQEQRYSPLEQINQDNISTLGLAWSFDTDYAQGLEATPLVVDGIMYFTGNWSMVYAVDARDGSLLWKYDPEVPKEWAIMACCDVVNRGVAMYEGKVFVGTLDARLIALDAATGEVHWSTQTADLSAFPYTITGAPRAAKSKVFIGNGGGEYGVRGYVSAYDVNTGELAWRFYTVPGEPARGFESEAVEKAAETWTGEWWKYGGGGTVWDSIVYDAELDQLYIGVGNGSPWNRHIRSPEGGDNLYLSSIVALNPDTGDYIWHYQETPAESWDYTATQHIMLADMEIDGASRKVIWHAPKNGFFFVIDRENGKLLSAEPFAKVTWASHYDLETGRPVKTPNADYKDGPVFAYPASMGAHNWQPMAHHPGTGLVYIPAMESPQHFEQAADYVHQWGQWNTGMEFERVMDNDLLAQALVNRVSIGELLAWDPVKQQPAWRVKHKLMWNGGLLATAGDVLFQGNADRFFAAYDVASGKELWRFDTQEGVVGSPVTYTVDGEQYVTVLVGWGGAFALFGGVEPDPLPEPDRGRVLTFKLNAVASLPPLPDPLPRTQPPARLTDDPAVIERGSQLYFEYCFACHGPGVVSNGEIPDLRRLPNVFYENFNAIVLDGIMQKAGMVGFGDVLDEEDAYAIKAHVLDQANDDWELSQQPKWWVELKKTYYSLIASIIVWLAEQ